jgi:EmrB/QacA subfamily drug resistance transporter
LVAGAFFMENLDATIIATAAPRMATDLGVAAVDINIVMTAYLLTLAVLIPASGWVSDRFGTRRVFVTAIAVFTVASVLCALATTLPVLVVVRILQGAGGALMVPVGRLVVLRATPKSQIITAIAYLTWPALVAPVVAPALGGLIVGTASWRWIFLVNLPLGMAALPLARWLVPDLRGAGPARLDWVGFLAGGAGLAAMLYGLEGIGVRPARVWPAVGGLAAGTLLCGVTVVHLLRTPRPLLDLRMLRIPTFGTASLGGSFFRIAISAVPFLVPLMLQESFGFSPVRAGLLVMAIFAGNLVIKPVTTPMLRRFGFRPVLLANGTAAALAIAACGLLGPGTPLPLIVLVLFAGGVFRSISFTAYNTMTYADIPPERTSGANALASTIFQLTVGMGVAVGALALRTAGPAARLLGLTGAGASYRLAFVMVAALSMIAVVDALRLAPDSGADVSGVRAVRPTRSRSPGRGQPGEGRRVRPADDAGPSGRPGRRCPG